VPPGGLRLIEAQGRRVVLARVGDAVYACEDVCAHRGGPLSQGKLTGHRLACPWHGWMYDVRTGRCVFPGRGATVATYPARVEDGTVWLELD
jgi:nitrite reductase/ring-hydroxylating ferredoxin subunit